MDFIAHNDDLQQWRQKIQFHCLCFWFFFVPPKSRILFPSMTVISAHGSTKNYIHYYLILLHTSLKPQQLTHAYIKVLMTHWQIRLKEQSLLQLFDHSILACVEIQSWMGLS